MKTRAKKSVLNANKILSHRNITVRDWLVGFVLTLSKTKRTFHRYTVDGGSPSTPSSDEILAAMNISTKDVDVGSWVRLWDTNERY